jgi:hypothetical protein
MLALSPAMYVARFSHDVPPVNRERAGTQSLESPIQEIAEPDAGLDQRSRTVGVWVST